MFFDNSRCSIYSFNRLRNPISACLHSGFVEFITRTKGAHGFQKFDWRMWIKVMKFD